MTNQICLARERPFSPSKYRFVLCCRSLDNDDELHFGVLRQMLYARNIPAIEGAQWTGIITQIAIEMLQSGKVDAVVCVQSDPNDRRVLQST